MILRVVWDVIGTLSVLVGLLGILLAFTEPNRIASILAAANLTIGLVLLTIKHDDE